jgi:hypothetical protein
VGDEDDLDVLPAQIMARLDDPPAASSPAVPVPLPGGAEPAEPGAAPGAELVAVTDSGPTGVADSAFSERSATPVEPSDAMTGAASAFVRSAVRAEPSPDDHTDPWANLARARTSAFVGAPALALPLPSGDVGSRTAAHEVEHRGRRRGVWAAIASGVVAAAAVVVYIAMDHRAPGAHSRAAMSVEQGGQAIEQTATTAVPPPTAPRPAAPPSELTASSVGTGGQHAAAGAGTVRLGTASNPETASGGAAASAGAGGAATASAGSGGERSIIGVTAGWRSGDAAKPDGAGTGGAGAGAGAGDGDGDGSGVAAGGGAEGNAPTDVDGIVGGIDPAGGAKPAPPAVSSKDAGMGGTLGDAVATNAPPKSKRTAKGTAAKPDAVDGKTSRESGAAGGRAPSAGDAGGGKGTAPRGAPAAGDRARLSDEGIARGMQPVSGKVRACFVGAHGAAALRFAVAPSGRVVTAVVIGALAGTSGAGCATSAVRTAAFAPWSGAPQIVEYRVPLD